MQYKILQVINNNTVMAVGGAADEDPVILMSKGIGFGAKKGGFLSDVGRDHQIYKLWTTPAEEAPTPYDPEQLAAIVAEFAESVGKLTGLSAAGLYPALLDHITFAADRVTYGLGLDNPLQREILVLYTAEFSLGRECTDHIHAVMGLDLGDAEACYIAMHIRAALHGRAIGSEMRDAHAYTLIANRLEAHFPGAPMQGLLLVLSELVEGVQAGRAIRFPAAEAVVAALPESSHVAGELAGILLEQRKIRLDTHLRAYLAVEIERARQLGTPHPEEKGDCHE